MIIRFFSALGWISLIISLAIFLVSYAKYPQEVLVYIDRAGVPQMYITKGSFFYILLAFLMVLNAVVIGLKLILQSYQSTELTQISLHISQLFFNLFFASSVYFISILNSRENFDYSNFGYLIYVTGSLMVLAIIFTIVSNMLFKKYN